MRKKTYLSVLALTWMGLTSNAQGTFTVDLSSTNGMSDFGSLFYNVLSGPIPVQTGDTISISYTIPNASDPFSGLVFTDRLALGGGTPPHRLSNPSLWGFTLNATPSFIGPDLTTMTAEYTITSTYGKGTTFIVSLPLKNYERRGGLYNAE